MSRSAPVQQGLDTGRRRFLALAAAAAGAGTVGACSSPSRSAAAGGEGSKSFTYWSMWQADEPHAQVMKTAVDAFQHDTGIKVTVVWQGRGVLSTFANAVNGRTPVPDLVDQDINTVMSGMVPQGWASDLSAVYKMPVPGENATVADVIPDKYMNLLSAPNNGYPVMVPYEVASEAIFFDAARHPEIAANKPGTWEDFVALLNRLKASGPALALDPTDANAGYWTAWSLERELGPGQLEKVVLDKTGASWNEPAVLDGVRRIESLISGGYFAPGYATENTTTTTAGGGDQQRAWAEGRTALILGGTWTPGEVRQVGGLKPSNIDSFVFPRFAADGDASASVNFFGFAVPTAATHADAAQKFIAYFLNKSRLSSIVSVTGNLTSRADIAAPPELQSIQNSLIVRTVYPDLDGLRRDLAPWFNQVYRPIDTEFMKGEITAAQWITRMRADSLIYWAGTT
jgi:ABC-type glycerol-3-phosphate transport system substrate-binding protein